MGDMYMAVSGLPDECVDHAKCIAKLALNMMDESKKVTLPSGAKIQVSKHVTVHILFWYL